MGGLRRRLLFRPHPGVVAAAPLVLFRPHPSPLPHGRGGKRWWAAAPPVALPPSPQPSPSRARGPDFRPHPGAVPRGRGGRRRLVAGGLWGGAALPPVALPPSPQPSPSRARGPDFRPHPGAVPRGRGGRRRLVAGGLWWAAAPLVALPPSPQPSPSRARGPDFRPHPSPLPRGRGGRTSALTPALSLTGEGVGGGGRLAPPVALPPSPQPSPSRARGPDFRPHPSVVAAAPPVALPPSPRPSPSRERGPDFRPHPGALPRGRGSREAVGCRGFVGEGWMVGGCAAGALPPSPQPSPSRARGPNFRPHPSPLPRGRGGREAVGCRGFVGEGWMVGGCAAGSLPPSPQPSPSRARGPRGGWLPGVCGGGVDGGRLRRRLLSRPHPSPLPRGRGGRTSALTPALSLAGEGAGGGWLPGVCGGGVCGGRLAPPVALPPSPQPSPSRARGPDFRPHSGAVPRGGGGRRRLVAGGLWGRGRWWAACAAGSLPPSPQPSPSRARGWEVVGGLRRRFSSALTPTLSLAGEGAGLPPSPQPSPSRARGPDFRPHPSPLPRGRGSKIAPPVAFCCVLVLLLCSLARAGSYCLMPQASLHNPRTIVTPAFFYSAPARSQGEKANAGRERVDTYAQEPIMDCVGQRMRSAHFPFSPTA